MFIPTNLPLNFSLSLSPVPVVLLAQNMLEMPGQLVASPVVSSAAPSASKSLDAQWTIDYKFGYPYLSDLDIRIDTNSPFMFDLKGRYL